MPAFPIFSLCFHVCSPPLQMDSFTAAHCIASSRTISRRCALHCIVTHYIASLCTIRRRRALYHFSGYFKQLLRSISSCRVFQQALSALLRSCSVFCTMPYYFTFSGAIVRSCTLYGPFANCSISCRCVLLHNPAKTISSSFAVFVLAILEIDGALL